MWSSLYYWLLAKYLTLLAFIFTLVMARTLAALARRSVPSKVVLKLDTFFRGLIYVSAGIFIAVVLWGFRQQAGITWISRNALSLSLTLDLFFLGGVLFYFYSLKRLQRHPDRFPYSVTVSNAAKWPDSAVVTRPLRLGLSQLLMVRKWTTPEFQITPTDYTRRLGRNPRLLDEVSDSSILGYSKSELAYFPHLNSHYAKASDESASVLADNDSLNANQKPTLSSDAHRTLNRALVAGLPDDLWNTSIRLCQTSPQIIATTWKQFYQQKSLRLRLVSLFNAVDMFQRLIGAIAFTVLRDEDVPETEFVIEGMKLPGNMNQWNQGLRDVLENTATPNLASLRHALLTSRDDFNDLLKRLNPIREILGEGIFRISGPRDTLAGWKLLGDLRNKLIGHGGVGWRLSVDVTINLSSLHLFFLAMMQDVSQFDLGVLAIHKNSDLMVIGLDRGLNRALNASAECSALARIPESDSVIELNPYFRFNTGRLLVLNGYRYNSSVAEYTDYNSANPLEPSFFSFPEERKSFVQKRQTPGLSFTALGSSLRESLSQNETALLEARDKTNLGASLATEDKPEEALVVIHQATARCESLLSKEVKFFAVLAELFFASAVNASCLLKLERTEEALALAEQISTYALRLSDSVEEFATVWGLLIEDQRNDVIKEVALSLLGLGKLLMGSRTFDKALICNHLAFSMFENMPENQWEEVPFLSFAIALFDKSYSLLELSQTNMAIASYEKAIRVFNDFLSRIAEVEQSGRDKALRFDTLTHSVENKLSGNITNMPTVNLLSKPILRGVGKLIPVEVFKNVIALASSAIITRAHEKYGKPDVLRNLIAQAWGNMGLAFQALGDLHKSLSCLDQAIELHGESLENTGDLGQAKELARTHENEALLFSEMERWQEALDGYDQAINLRERCVQGGMLEVQPQLLWALRQRFNILLRQRRWNEAVVDIARFLDHLTASDHDTARFQMVQKELQLVISSLREMQPDDLASLFSLLGSVADRIKELMKE
jgi:tetratricopeptide (TPR) repeat protein